MTAELINEIENGQLRLDLHFASTPKSLLLRLESNPSFKEAQKAIRQNPSVACAFLERAEILFDSFVAPGYQHPDDMALTIYLYLIGSMPDSSIRAFVHQVAMTSKQGFKNATAIASYVLRKTPQMTVQPQQREVSANAFRQRELLQSSGGSLVSRDNNPVHRSFEKWLLANTRPSVDLLHVSAA